MVENNDKENKEGESSEEEARSVIIPDNPSVALTDVQGEIYAASDETGYLSLEKWFADLPRDETTAEKVNIFVADDRVTVEAAEGGIGISVPLSLVEELIAAYRAEVAARIRTTS